MFRTCEHHSAFANNMPQARNPLYDLHTFIRVALRDGSVHLAHASTRAADELTHIQEGVYDLWLSREVPWPSSAVCATASASASPFTVFL